MKDYLHLSEFHPVHPAGNTVSILFVNISANKMEPSSFTSANQRARGIRHDSTARKATQTKFKYISPGREQSASLGRDAGILLEK